MESITQFFQLTGFAALTWQMTAMWGVVSVLFYLAIYKRFEPLLLVPIAFGALVANLPTKGIIHDGVQADGTVHSGVIQMEATLSSTEPTQGETQASVEIHRIEGGLFDIITQGVKNGDFSAFDFSWSRSID